MQGEPPGECDAAIHVGDFMLATDCSDVRSDDTRLPLRNSTTRALDQ
jgi:hypothetical protein